MNKFFSRFIKRTTFLANEKEKIKSQTFFISSFVAGQNKNGFENKNVANMKFNIVPVTEFY